MTTYPERDAHTRCLILKMRQEARAQPPRQRVARASAHTTPYVVARNELRGAIAPPPRYLTMTRASPQQHEMPSHMLICYVPSMLYRTEQRQQRYARCQPRHEDDKIL